MQGAASKAGEDVCMEFGAQGAHTTGCKAPQVRSRAGVKGKGVGPEWGTSSSLSPHYCTKMLENSL